MRRLRQSAILVVTGVLILFLFDFKFQFYTIFREATDHYYVNRSSELICKLPHLDPFDPNIQRYYAEIKPQVCSRVQPYYSFVKDAKLSLNNSEDLTKIQCFYQIYTCCSTNTNGIRFTERKPIGPNIEVDVGSTADTVTVECEHGGERVYYNVHAAPSLRKHKAMGKKILHTDEDHLSVLLVMHDSVSAVMFKSQLQQTHAYLTKQMGAFDMDGFTKIADNTRPNMFAFLTGKRYQKQQDDMPDEGLEELVSDKYNDRLPLIFKDFDRRNYAVSYIDDEPHIGLFTMGMDGFKNPSFFTHYLFPYYKQRELAGDDRRSDFKFSHLNGKGINLMCLGNENRYDENMKEATDHYYVNRSSELICKLPHLDPFDPNIQRYYAEIKPQVCSRVQPYYSFVKDAKLSLNNSEDLTKIQCFYQIYTCCSTNTNGIRFTERKPIGPNIEVDVGSTADTVTVECEHGGERVYYNVHAAPSLRKHKAMGKKILHTDEDHLSVLLVMHDSVSAVMFKSQLQQTHAYLTKQMGAFDMDGFTKIADNTRPNMFAFLTGKRYQKQQDDMPDEGLEELVSDKYNDRLPLIFKDFDRRNYAVSYIDDEPHIGLFTMGMDGFKNPSFFTHYLFPYYKQRELAGDDRRSDFKFSHLNGKGINLMCLGNENRYDENMKLIETIARSYAGRRLRSFLYSFNTRISHAGDAGHGVKNVLKQVDGNLVTMIRNLHKDGMLNETVVVFGSDHGARFGQQRQTLEGVIEDRMPYFSIAFPPWFLAKHPHIRTALAQNQHRLTTHFDVHSTLLDIAQGRYTASQRNGTRNLSQLYPLPSNRTCWLAGIPGHYCVCFDDQQLATDHPYAIAAASLVIKTLNTLLSDFTNLCQTIILEEIRLVNLHKVNKKVAKGMRWEELTMDLTSDDYKVENYDTIQLVVKALPNNAVFEATVKRYHTGQMKLVNEISRLSKYGNSSACIQHEVYRKYCTCH